ncbi:pentapeptide repeat-containing protein [Coleofasciculus sp. F4-SAH-05]|uniref:pentapeptide repeat-containing protein n=1 Tax=Coleofasciculus sp. F4-SAH-05 TaxID=3069525 RepID=UPI0033019C2B
MKADEVLRRYAAGERDFRRVNLRGQSFKGINLVGADFSEADIRGANFTNAYLSGAKFCGAEAGLQRCWAVFFVIISWLLSSVSGYLSGVAGYLVGLIFYSSSIKDQISGWVTLIIILSFFFITIRQGIGLVLGVVAGAVTIAVAIAVVITGDITFESAGVVAGAIAYAVVGAVAFAGAVVFAGAIAFAGAVVFAGAMAFAGAVTGVVNGAEAEAVVGTGAYAVAGTLAFAFTLISAYFGWQAIKGDKKYALIRMIVIAFAATGGTSFRRANLTNADFTRARLKSTDFRKAILTSTRWRDASKLDLVRPGTSYLSSVSVRELVRTLRGQDKNFDQLSLRGVNLQGANLADASFIRADLNEANLQDADLSRAKLIQTQLDEAHLTGATLTGATIEDWGITRSTKLHGIICQYVFMRLPTKDDPNQRRKPDNWEEEFEDGDFANFIKPIVDTLDFYHNQGVDPRAIAISFKQLAEKNPEAELEIVAMEKRGKDKFLLRAATAPDADHSKLNAEYFTTYNQIKALAEAEVQALLAEKDSRISSLETMVETALQRPNFYASNQIQEVTNMTSNPGGFSVGGSVGGNISNLQGDHNLQGDNNQTVQGNHNQVTQGQGSVTAEEQFTKADVIKLLAELDKLVRAAELPEGTKEEATMYLGAAKKATEKEEPKKETALANMESVAETLETASKTVDLGKNFWDTAKPIISKVAGWLGAAAGSSLLGL